MPENLGSKSIRTLPGAFAFSALIASVSIAFSLTAEAQGLTTAATEKDAAALAQNLGDSYISEVKTKRARKGQPEDVDAFLSRRGQKEDVMAFVDIQMEVTAGDDGERLSDSRMQLRRLWWLAAPQLVQHLGDPNGYASESARETLVMMRSDAVVNAIIERLKSTEDREVWIAGLYTLGMMTEKYDTMVPGRTVMGEAESKEMAERLIKPFLTKVQKEKKDPEIQKVIGDAFRLLEEATDRRWRKITDPNEIPEQFRNLPLERPK